MIRRLFLTLALLAGLGASAQAGSNMFVSGRSKGLFAAPAAPPAATAWNAVSVFASSQVKTSNDPWTFTTANTVESGNVAFCLGAVDNDGDGTDTNDFNTQNDSAGNTWANPGENETDPGAASAGTAVALTFARAASAIPSGGTVGFNYPAARNSKAGVCMEFTITGTTVTVVGTEQKEDAVGADAGALTVSSLSSGEHLCIRAVSSETGTTETITATSGWTAIGDVGTTGSTDNTNQRVWGEYKIFTGTSSGASDPTFSGTSIDRASTMVCFDQS